MPGPRQTSHEIAVAAPPAAVYGLIADVTNWPRVFPPTVHVEHVERGHTEELIRIWATANGEVKSWTSRRTLDPAAHRVAFRQVVSQPPVASMGGEWEVLEDGEGRSRVVLRHDFTAVGDSAENVAWIEQAIDRNSHAELDALRRTAEQGQGELFLEFEDIVRVLGEPKDVYDFLYQAQHWEERLPHVARVALTEDTEGVQTLEMDTRTKDGSLHTTKSVRVGFTGERIVYKQLKLPALLEVHNGLWTIEPTPDGVDVSSQHTVVLKASAIPEVLGADATVEDARAFVQRALSGNSLATLELAKDYAEQRRPS
ncbi:aromatase/cyclase [Amycolatopsis sp. lyj-23]|uniref:aromatase/cyclase n=1 Tax=Amycolatopsis sp. lyj-23 TaxID=2789283 RepID=UPI00397BF1B8